MPRSRCRAGLTLVEVMLALVVLASALLSVAGVTAALLRAANRSALDARLSAAADRRLESLAAQPCTLLTGGELDAPPLHEHWTVAPGSRSVAIGITASAPFGGTTRTATRTTHVRCPPSP